MVKKPLIRVFLVASLLTLLIIGIDFNVTRAVDYERFEPPLSNGFFGL